VIEAKKESSTRHKFGKIWSNLAIKFFFLYYNHLEVLSLFAFVVNPTVWLAHI
jgi:hypothetical protein